MMVSKVAVIALVAIVACPILMGYAMNLTEVTETDYVSNKDPVNVTPLLEGKKEYSYAAADVVDINSRFMVNRVFGNADFARYTTTKTSIPMSCERYNYVPEAEYIFSNYSYFYGAFDYDFTQGFPYVYIILMDDTQIKSDPILTMYYDFDAQSLYYSYYELVDNDTRWRVNQDEIPDVKGIWLNHGRTFNGTYTFMYKLKNTPPSTYIDIAAGYYVNNFPSGYFDAPANYPDTHIETPRYTKSVLMTMNLNTVTNSNFTMGIYDSISNKTYNLVKTTDSNDVVKWSANWVQGWNTNTTPVLITDLYYDPTSSSNTYQINLSTTGLSFDYVGSWPTIIGKANSYWNYTYDHETPTDSISINIRTRTPLMRIDAAEYRAFTYLVIENKTYDPSQFKTNPSTTLKNIAIYGSSLVFGGNTYNITKGNITMGTHQVSLNGLRLESVPVAVGYENKINGTTVSTTPTPSTITFNGKWSADISTVSMSTTTYTKTSWTPGEFAWNGIDQNFLMIGLLAALGVFIALGIAYRSTKSALISLLIVCGGAVMLIIVML